jgi:GPH family glycoside/pentoside/hexuronide:cation symporter
VLGLFMAAVTFRPVAGLFGGGAPGYALAGAAFGVLMALPWFAVYRNSWERPEFQSRAPQVPLLEGLRILARHRSFRRLTALFLGGRISMDLVGAMLIIYFTHVIGRSGDFEITMGLFIATEVVSLPLWLSIAHRYEKSTLFIVGSVWWLLSLVVILVAEPGWPRWLLLVFAPLGAAGFALVDLMPWSMLGEVVDEDDVATGERREGLYNGFFMFLRKLGGTIAVALALALLGAVGFGREQPSERALLCIRLLTSVGPAVFLAFSIWMARAYPLTREVHAGIRATLDARAGRP